jgi:signal transduction histidine kinase/CheY-like chemotaxis protein
MGYYPAPRPETIALEPLDLSVPVGSRIAYLYDSPSTRTRFAPFINTGLIKGDKCVIFTDLPGRESFRRHLSELGANVERHELGGDLVFLTSEMMVDKVEQIGNEIVEDAKTRSGLVRGISDGAWMADLGWTPREFFRLEVKCHIYGPYLPGTFICQYDLARTKREKIGHIIGAHHYIVTSDGVEQNPDRRLFGQVVFDGMDEQIRALSQLQDLSLRLAGSLNLDQILDALTDAAVAICRSERAAISSFDESGELRIIKHRGLSDEYLKSRRFVRSDPQVSELLATKEPLIIEDIDDLADSSPNYEAWKREGVRSIVTLPLIREGEVFGVIGTSSQTARHYSQTEVDAMAILAAQAAAAITNAKLFEQLTEANRAKDEFLATLSHELRTPLTPILGWIRILSRFESHDPMIKQGFEVIERNARQQADLINDLLDLTRITSGKIDFYRQPTDVCSLIDSTTNTVRPQAEARNIRIGLTMPETPVIFNIDPLRIRQIIVNLLSNAIKFTPDAGNVEISLAYRGRPGDQQDAAPAQVIIEVIDNGIGIAPDFLPRVFDRFSQANGGINRLYGGLGLGLAITRALVEMHNGTIEVHSGGLGLGSRFTVRLPALSEPIEGSHASQSPALSPVSAPTVSEQPLHAEGLDGQRLHATESPRVESRRPGLSAPNGSDSGSDAASNAGRFSVISQRIRRSTGELHPIDNLGLNLLVIEDSDDTLDMLKRLLTAYGCQVRGVTSASAGLESAAAIKPDLIISDIGMPEVDGYTFISELRKSPGLSQVPAIALTGYARDEDRELALAAGYDAHLAKPAEMAHLLAIIKRLTGRTA